MPSRRRRNTTLATIATLPLLTTPLHAATATWLSPTSGTWSDPTRWSTSPLFPGSPSYESFLSPTGSPYTITATGSLSVGRTNLTSPDATLDLAGTSFSATGGLYVSPGATARLRAGELHNTSVHGTLLLAPLTPTTPLKLRSVTLTNADLRAAPGAPASPLSIESGLTLNNATVHLAPSLRPTLVGSISGTGALLHDNPPGTTLGLSISPAAGTTAASFASGVTLRALTPGGRLVLSGTTTGMTFTNAGTIAADAPKSQVFLPQSLNLSNTGTLTVSSGGDLQAYIGGDTGTLQFGPGGGSIFLHGPAYNLTQPVLVPAGTQLTLAGGWQNSSNITVEGGTLSLIDSSQRPGALTFLNNATLALYSSYTPASVRSLGINPSTRVVMRETASLDLGNAPLDFWTLPGQWSFSSADASIRNGTLLTGLAGSSRLTTSPTDALRLNNLTVDFPLTLDQGSVTAASATFTKPISLSGTGRLVLSTLVNTTPGITATSGGTLAISSPPTSSLGPVSLSRSSTLEFDYNTSFHDITMMRASRPSLTPGTIAIGPGGSLALQSQSPPFDLANAPYALALVAGQSGGQSAAHLTDGTLSDSSAGLNPFRVYAAPGYSNPEASLTNVNLSTVTLSVAAPATLVLYSGNRLDRSRVTGDGALDIRASVTLSNATLEVPTRLSGTAFVDGALTLHSTLTLPQFAGLSLTNNASLAGTGTLLFTGIRNSSGSVQAASPLTLPAGVTINPTYVNALIAAPALTLQGPLLLQPTPDADPTLPTLTLRAPTTRIDSPLSISAGRLVLDTTTTRLTAPLTLTDTATVDLKSSLLLLDPPVPASSDTIRTALLAGRLTSSSASPDHRLAYIPLSLLPPSHPNSSAATTAGATPTATLIRLTLTGDANLDGVTNSDDYALIDRGFATSGQYWWHGDFNYDGQVDQNDYLLIDRAYLLTKAQGWQSLGSSFFAQRTAQFGPTYVSQLLTSIPEPATPLLSTLCFLLTSRLLPRIRPKSKLYN